MLRRTIERHKQGCWIVTDEEDDNGNEGDDFVLSNHKLKSEESASASDVDILPLMVIRSSQYILAVVLKIPNIPSGTY